MRYGDDQAFADTVEALSASVILLENDSRDLYLTGTLFFSSGPVVITNYHLLEADTDTVHVFLTNESGDAEKFSAELIQGDRTLDIAAFRIVPSRPGQIIPPMRSGIPPAGYIAGNQCLTTASFACPGDIRRGVRVVFLGFPLHYGMDIKPGGLRLSKSPIVREGFIASVVARGEFLIDAMVSNGNSGSPVFIRSSKGPRIAGIIKEFQHDSIPFRSESGTMTAIPHNAGLGAVIPIQTVAAFLERLPVDRP
jgi:S1-C subfamily serine protease